MRQCWHGRVDKRPSTFDEICARLELEAKEWEEGRDERELKATASTGSMGSDDGDWTPVSVINPAAAAGHGYEGTDDIDVSQAHRYSASSARTVSVASSLTTSTTSVHIV